MSGFIGYGVERPIDFSHNGFHGRFRLFAGLAQNPAHPGRCPGGAGARRPSLGLVAAAATSTVPGLQLLRPGSLASFPRSSRCQRLSPTWYSSTKWGNRDASWSPL